MLTPARCGGRCGNKAPTELGSVTLSCGAQVGRQVGSNREQQMVWPGVSWGWEREKGQAYLRVWNAGDMGRRRRTSGDFFSPLNLDPLKMVANSGE